MGLGHEMLVGYRLNLDTRSGFRDFPCLRLVMEVPGNDHHCLVIPFDVPFDISEDDGGGDNSSDSDYDNRTVHWRGHGKKVNTPQGSPVRNGSAETQSERYFLNFRYINMINKMGHGLGHMLYTISIFGYNSKGIIAPID